jgi:hypothetical protein
MPDQRQDRMVGAPGDFGHDEVDGCEPIRQPGGRNYPVTIALEAQNWVVRVPEFRSELRGAV